MQRFDVVRAAARGARDTTRPSKVTGVKATKVATTAVTLTWAKAHDNVKVVKYDVFRDGKRATTTTKTTWTDRHVTPTRTYAYTVRAVDRAGNHGALSKALKLKVPAVGTTIAPPVVTTTTPPVTTPSDPQLLTRAMVDRLWWRAGFGATDVERAAWVGKPVADLVTHFVSSTQVLDADVPPPLTQDDQPIDPTVTREELVMEWLWTMQRAQNPLIERLTFFLHRHWSITLEQGGIPNETILTYRDRLRRFGDIAANPTSSFKQLAFEMTTHDGSMSLFLNGWQNVVGHPNENYAREFMELFVLGVRDGQGNANYTQDDVTNLARAFTGWDLDQNPGPTFGTVSFVPDRFDDGHKTLFGQTANFGADPSQGSGASSVIDLIFSHPAHVPHLVTKLWSEFIVTPIPADALASLSTAYYANGQFLLKPLVQGILSHPLIFESLDEPPMIKPPVVYLVGMQRPFKAPMKWFWQHEVLGNMQQCPYEAPNVAGWEGGLAWLNSNTVQARFDAVLRTIHLTYDSDGYPSSSPIADVPGETGVQAFARAWSLCGTPWLSQAAATQIQTVATSHASSDAEERRQRIYCLIALIIGGPDGQVM